MSSGIRGSYCALVAAVIRIESQPLLLPRANDRDVTHSLPSFQGPFNIVLHGPRRVPLRLLLGIHIRLNHSNPGPHVLLGPEGSPNVVIERSLFQCVLTLSQCLDLDASTHEREGLWFESHAAFL